MPTNPLWRWFFLSLGLLLLIVVPFLLFEQQVTAWSEAILSKESPPWVIAATLVGLLASDILLPIPSSFIATASGYMLGLWWGTLATWTGLMAGTLVGYALGLRYGRSVAQRFVGESELQRVAAAHERFGNATIVALRAVPVLAEASVVLAGLSNMPLGRFVLLTALANLGIAVTYAAVGAFAVDANSFLLAFAGSIALPGLAMLLARFFSRS